MESLNKSFDVNGKFGEIDKIFETCKENGHGEEYKGMAIKVVKGLIDILKKSDPKKPNAEIVNRVCKFVDEASGFGDGVLWELSRDGGLISFLKELARRGLVSQIDKIFRCGIYECPLVNNLSRNPMIKNEFNELFSMLPEDYRDKLSGEIISYQDGDKDYAYPLIGGTALMGF